MPEEQIHQHSYMLRSAKIIYQLNRKMYLNQETKKKLFKKVDDSWSSSLALHCFFDAYSLLVFMGFTC